jgi:hypothetical protein
MSMRDTMMVLETNFVCEHACDLAAVDLLILKDIHLFDYEWMMQHLAKVPRIILDHCFVSQSLMPLQPRMLSKVKSLIVWNTSFGIEPVLPVVPELVADLSVTELTYSPWTVQEWFMTGSNQIQSQERSQEQNTNQGTNQSSNQSTNHGGNENSHPSQDSLEDSPLLCAQSMSESLYLYNIQTSPLSNPHIHKCTSTLVLSDLGSSAIRQGLHDLQCRKLVLVLYDKTVYGSSDFDDELYVLDTYPVISQVPHLSELISVRLVMHPDSGIAHLRHLFLFECWWPRLSDCDLGDCLPQLQTLQVSMDREQWTLCHLPDMPLSPIRLRIHNHPNIQVVQLCLDSAESIEIVSNPELISVILARKMTVYKIIHNPMLEKLEVFGLKTMAKQDYGDARVKQDYHFCDIPVVDSSEPVWNSDYIHPWLKDFISE